MNKQVKFGVIGAICSAVVLTASLAIACPDCSGGKNKECVAKSEKSACEKKPSAKVSDQKAQLKLESPKTDLGHGRHGRGAMARDRILQKD